MHLYCLSLITSEIFQLTNRYRYQFVGEAMTDILSTKNNQTCDPWASQGNEKCNFYSIAFCVDILIRNENIDYD